MLNNNAVDAVIGLGILSSLFLEAMNATWFALSLCLVFIYSLYIWLNRGRGFYELKAACAINVYFIGEALQRGWVWLWRHQINDNMSTSWMDNIPVVPVAGVLAVIGGLWMIRMFGPERWGNYGWLSALAFITLFLVAIVIS